MHGLTRSRAVAAAALSLCTSACGTDETSKAGVPSCEGPTPGPEALLRAGPVGEGRLLPGGRMLTPAGIETVLGGFPVDVRIHPTLPVAYVSNTGYSARSLQVVDIGTGQIAQELVRSDAFFGLEVSPDGTRLFASGGSSGLLDIYDIDDDGALSPASQVQLGGYPAGIALSPDGQRLWVALFLDRAIAEVDLTSMAAVGRIELPFGPYALAHVESRDELYATGFADKRIAIVDIAASSVINTVEVAGNPNGLAVDSGGTRVFATIPDGDMVVAFDTASRVIVLSQTLGVHEIQDKEGGALPATSPSGITLHGDRLFVARAADNAVQVLDAATLAPAGAIPVGWYPTAVAVSTNGRLVVTNGKGLGTGPLPSYGFGDESGKEKMAGSVSIVDINTANLEEMSARVRANVRRPADVLPFDCDGAFPVPTSTGGPTPIRHVVLIVRENKTYDSLFGDLPVGVGDPSLVMYGEDVTPNIRTMARTFAHHDNFYDDGETSVQGHLWLTSSFVNDYMERIWLEDYRGAGDFGKEAALDQGQPDFGTFFTHLIEHDVSFRNFGEVVGSLGSFEGETVLSRTDLKFPGMFYNTDVKDEEKARYVAEALVGEEGEFPSFVYVLLPNDHTHGTSPGALTPEAMINDNDYATGLLVDTISHSPYWKETAIFIVEDDPQIGADHLEYHRSICVVVSPWAKRGYVSSVHTSIPSLFRTFELILGVPPMNRFDATATPLYDVFTMTPDMTPFDAIPRTVPDSTNPASATGAAWSMEMDFSGPDRNPDLGAILWWAKFGSPPPRSRVERVMNGLAPWPFTAGDSGEEEEEEDVYEESWDRVEQWLREHPEVEADPRPRRKPPRR